MENIPKITIVSSCVISALIVCFSRIYLQYHTISQVLCGALVGFLFATIWFALTCCVFTPLYPQIVSWRISEVLLLRDTTLIPNVLWFEYTKTREEVRARSRKLVSMKSQWQLIISELLTAIEPKSMLMGLYSILMYWPRKRPHNPFA